jgi:ferric-dicitrate binding protein FerR (iron transport regulator)
VQIDGRPTSLNAPAEIARRLHSGARVLLPADAQLDLRLPEMAVIQLVGGSHATLPSRPGRWFARSMVASLDAGEIRISAGPAFRGARLEVVTPEARAIVTGTTLAVLRQADASCVCVLEGRVSMIQDGSTATVYAGFRRSVFRDGSGPRVEPIRPMETMKLTMLRAQAEQALGH